MHYLNQLYSGDEKGIKEVLEKIYQQFFKLEDDIRANLANDEIKLVAQLCHKMSNSATLVGAVELKRALLSLETDITSNNVGPAVLNERIVVLVGLIQPVQEMIKEQLLKYE